MCVSQDNARKHRYQVSQPLSTKRLRKIVNSILIKHGLDKARAKTRQLPRWGSWGTPNNFKPYESSGTLRKIHFSMDFDDREQRDRVWKEITMMLSLSGYYHEDQSLKTQFWNTTISIDLYGVIQ